MTIQRGDVHQSGSIFGTIEDGGLEFVGKELDCAGVAALGSQVHRGAVWK